MGHHSRFGKAACERDFQENINNRIDLPEHDVTAFSLFVEWMYHGSCSPEFEHTFLPRHDPVDQVALAVKCWVLADSLVAVGFANHAMNWIYDQYVVKRSVKEGVTVHDVRYVCENTPPESKLRTFYYDYVLERFSDRRELIGCTKEWDDLLLEVDDLRSSLLDYIRSGRGRKCLMEKKDYLEEE